MFYKIKKFARENRHKSIILGIVIVVTGAFLAWLVNVAFLAVMILGFIWTGYFYFLGTEHNTLDKNKTNDSKSKLSKDIKLKI